MGERVAAVGEVVVAEHDEARPEAVEQPLELAHPRAAGDEVARDAHEIRPALGHPVHRLAHGAEASRRHAEMEVGEVRDPQPVELRRDPVEPHVQDALPQPPRLEPRPGGDSRDRDGEREQEPGQTESFSVTGSTETT